MKPNGIDVLFSHQKRVIEFYRMIEIIERKYKGGWLIAVKNKNPDQKPRRLSNYIIVEDINDYASLKIGMIFGAFGKPKSKGHAF